MGRKGGKERDVKKERKERGGGGRMGGEGGGQEEEEEEEDNRTTRRRSIHIVSMLHTVAVASWVQSERKGTHGRREEGGGEIHQILRMKREQDT